MTAAQPERRDSGLAVGVLLALLSLTATGAALEVGARVLGLENDVLVVFTPERCLQRSPVYGFELRPNCSRDSARWTWHTNSLGLRSAEIRADGSVRILALGDSNTWGWGADQAHSYPEALQQLLDAKYGAGRYQVINTGVPAWTSYQGATFLRERGMALDPDIVIIAFGYNDAQRNGDDEDRLRHAVMPLVKVDDYLIGRSRFYSWVRAKMMAAGSAHELPPRVAVEKYRRNLTDMIHRARRGGAHVLLLSFAQPSDDQRAHLEALASASTELGVPLVTYAGPRVDDVHPTVDGYRQLAVAVLETLERSGFVPAARAPRA